MAGIRIEFAQFGDFDSFSVYRSSMPMNVEALPNPLKSDLKTMYFLDTSVVLEQLYYYRVAAFRDGEIQVSDEFKCKATTFIQTAVFFIFNSSVSRVEENGKKLIFSNNSSGWVHATVNIKRSCLNNAYYIEFLIGTTNLFYTDSLAIGISQTQYPSGNAGQNGMTSYISSGLKRNGGGRENYAEGYKSGDSIGILIKNINGNTGLYFYKNGISQGLAYTLSGTNEYYPVVSFYSESTTFSANLHIQDFTVSTIENIRVW